MVGSSLFIYLLVDSSHFELISTNSIGLAGAHLIRGVVIIRERRVRAALMACVSIDCSPVEESWREGGIEREKERMRMRQSQGRSGREGAFV